MAVFFLMLTTIGSFYDEKSIFKLYWSKSFPSFGNKILLSTVISLSYTGLIYFSKFPWILFLCFRSASLDGCPSLQSGHLKESIIVLAANFSAKWCFFL
jgi:hypothetical protein